MPNLVDPYMLGYTAYRNQSDLNPFENGSSDWRVWSTGFQTAKAED